MADEDANYAVELEQVRAALSLDPTNEDLLKLEQDLQTLFELKKLEKQQNGENGTAPEWKVGDECEAVWATDGQYYAAVIDAITEQGCSVTYTEYNEKGTVALSSLRKRSAKRSHDASEKAPSSGPSTATGGMSRAEKEAERERKKLKREKKKQKLEEKQQKAKETQSSWQKFNSTVSKRAKTGFKTGKKESIFKTPDAVDGKVGVGTCGIGGKGMTGDFKKRDKWQYKE